MDILKTLNAGLSFVLELCMLAALGYFGFSGEKSTATKWLLGLGLPLVAIALWAIFAAPKANHRLELPFRILFELAVFGVAAFALYKTGHHTLAIAFALAALANESLAFVWKQ